MTTLHDSFPVYLGTSVNASNGVQKDLPVFGRFAARVACDTIRLCSAGEHWWIGLPWGSSMSVGGETATREKFAAIKARGGYDAWTTDWDSAAADATTDARGRHNAAASRTAYARKFGARVEHV